MIEPSQWDELLHRVTMGTTGPDDAALLDGYLEHLISIAEKAVRVTEIADAWKAEADSWKAVAESRKIEIDARQKVGLS